MSRTSAVQVNRGLGSRYKKRKKEVVSELSITSLLDILTILLVFMIKNVSMDAAARNAPEGMELPVTISKDDLIERGHVLYVKIYPDKILYGSDNQMVGTLQEFMTDKNTREVLLRFLKAESDVIKDSNMNPVLLIQADKNLECRYIAEFINFSTEAKFADIYFSSTATDNIESVFKG
jgi:biopolymer transport protein ExbD